MESILTSIKKLLGIEAEYTHFDPDIIMGINMALMVLCQLGVGPTTGFSILDDTKKWIDFIGDKEDIEGVKNYVYLKTRLMFDPPANSFLIDSMERMIKELEWRLNIQVDKPVVTTTTTVEGGTGSV